MVHLLKTPPSAKIKITQPKCYAKRFMSHHLPGGTLINENPAISIQPGDHIVWYSDNGGQEAVNICKAA